MMIHRYYHISSYLNSFDNNFSLFFLFSLFKYIHEFIVPLIITSPFCTSNLLIFNSSPFICRVPKLVFSIICSSLKLTTSDTPSKNILFLLSIFKVLFSSVTLISFLSIKLTSTFS
ncbi:hypothetical protein CTC_00199 [Clostridium tetani E88]|uniref:Uncharacterized protein n=1 Tax=Clostridium tetani (strain Massachusetts / E88) TaxID=212717 RepID=Q899H8_CLOTE|nr:hypothetical protein CTC_00199 [Clostridium tetani E88]